jgi:hypothetical protein
MATLVLIIIMVEVIEASIRIARSMKMEPSPGLMVEVIEASISITRSMDKEHTTVLMVMSIEGSGRMTICIVIIVT